MPALSVAPLAILAWLLVLRLTGAGFDGDNGSHGGPAIEIDSVELPVREVTLAAPGDVRTVRRETSPPQPRTKRPVSLLPERDRDGLGEHLDPDTYPVSPFGGGVSNDVGEFQDPESALVTPLPHAGKSHVGDYMAPEEGP